MDKSREDKCEWITCGTIYWMRNILREKLSLAMVLKVGKLALTNNAESCPSQKKEGSQNTTNGTCREACRRV